MSNPAQFLGIVEDGTFRQLVPKTRVAVGKRFTTIAPQEARPPESGEVNLSEHEHRAIMFEGMDQGGWVYSARVVETAGPILTAVVRKVFLAKKK